MHYLITGAAGFVGRHIIAYLKSMDPTAAVFGTDVSEKPAWMMEGPLFSFHRVNLLDRDEFVALIRKVMPDRVIHLAAFSSVAYSWEHPAECFYNNNLIFINLIEALKESACTPRILSVGSSEEYGDVREEDVPLSERQPLAPTSPYGVARASQEMLSKVFANGYGLDIRMTRSFNHIGPYQRDTFVIPGFIKQLVNAELAGKKQALLRTGDVDVVRDFLDVRDVVRAYYAILERGESGMVYNVCFGLGRSLRECIAIIAKLMDMDVEIIVDQDKLRLSENRRIIGDNSRIRESCLWTPSIPFETTLIDTIAYWRTLLSAGENPQLG